jgi:hypothetical protein
MPLRKRSKHGLGSDNVMHPFLSHHNSCFGMGNG